MLLIGILVVILPVSFIFWIVNLVTTWLRPIPTSEADVYLVESASPLRWLVSFLIPTLIAAYGLRKKSLDRSGATAGILIGFLLTLSNYAFFASLFAFFISSSKATKFRSKQKASIELDFKEGGQRNWVQVICNGGIAAQMAILYMIDKGLTECSIDFDNDYGPSWFSIAVLASLAGVNGDTWASELGSVLAKGDPILITTFRRVPKGTNGGISVPGIIVSLLGGTFVGIMYYVALLLCLTSETLNSSPPQWPIILVASFAGLFNSVLDSVLGATLQFSGVHKKTGKIVEHPGVGVKRVSGIPFLDNHSVNLLSSFISSLFVPYVAIFIWHQLR